MDEILKVLNTAISGIYADETVTAEKAQAILRGTQCKLDGFLRDLVSKVDDDEAMSILSELDFKLRIPLQEHEILMPVQGPLSQVGIRKELKTTDIVDPDFVFDYDVSPTGASDGAYDLRLKFGDNRIGVMTITVNSSSCVV